MRWSWRPLTLTALVPALLLAGCGGSGAPVIDPGDGGDYSVRVNPDDFVATIDNPWLPFTPGSRWVYSAGGGRRNEVVVTHQTRKVMGITATVVRDTETRDGVVIEATFDWYAQDRDGNVWYLGEDTRALKNGRMSPAGSWEAGVDGALPGIVMKANPRVGNAYRQEFYRGHAEDMGKVVRIGASATVPFRSLDGLLVTQDWTPLEPTVVEEKYYAKGIGLVLETTVRGGSGRNELISYQPGRQAVAGASVTTTIATEKDFDRNRFSDPTTIDNPWFPLEPGTQFVYEGSAIADDQRIHRRVVFTVTDLTKMVNGVRTIVAWDRDYNDGQLVEPELVFFAQDDDGNVWSLGQYPEEYEDGRLVGTPAWIAGLEGARAGIVMRAEPSTGTSDYSQGWGPEVEYADRAKVHLMGQETCVPVGCYEDVLVTDEWDAADPAARQRKHYARGVGNIRVGWAGRDEEQEVLSLVNLVHLSPQAMAEVRREALKLERRADRLSKHLYGHTAPAEQPPGTG